MRRGGAAAAGADATGGGGALGAAAGCSGTGGRGDVVARVASVGRASGFGATVRTLSQAVALPSVMPGITRLIEITSVRSARSACAHRSNSLRSGTPQAYIS